MDFIDINKVYTSTVEVQFNAVIEVEVIKNDETKTIENISTMFEEYIELYDDTKLVEECIDRFNYILDNWNNDIKNYIKNSKQCFNDVISQLDIFYDNIEQYKEIKIINAKNVLYKVNRFDIEVGV